MSFLSQFTINDYSGYTFLAIIISLVLTGTGLVVAFSHFFAKYILIALIDKIFDKKESYFSQLLYKKQLLYRLAYLVPAFILHYFSEKFNFRSQHLNLLLADLVSEVTNIYIIIGIAFVISAFLNCIDERYNQHSIAKSKPIKSYLQVIKIILMIITSILVASIIFHQSPMYFFTGVGATTAFLALIFKDSVMGFIASIQIAAYDMVRLGDWIEMPTYGVDGDVMEISLNNIKVQNFDKSIVTIPSYALLTSGLKNWRGMYESGGRRVKRSILIDIHSIKLCDTDLLTQLKKFDLPIEISSSQTNLGLYRTYLDAYLKQHKHVHQRMKIIVRHLAGTTAGLPLELYFFTNETTSEKYEAIQAEIIEYAHAILPRFNLSVFQNGD